MDRESQSRKKSQGSRYRRDNQQAMRLQDNIRTLTAEQEETMARMRRLDDKLEKRKSEKGDSPSKKRSEEKLKRALDSIVSSMDGNRLK